MKNWLTQGEQGNGHEKIVEVIRKCKSLGVLQTDYSNAEELLAKIRKQLPDYFHRWFLIKLEQTVRSRVYEIAP